MRLQGFFATVAAAVVVSSTALLSKGPVVPATPSQPAAKPPIIESQLWFQTDQVEIQKFRPTSPGKDAYREQLNNKLIQGIRTVSPDAPVIVILVFQERISGDLVTAAYKSGQKVAIVHMDLENLPLSSDKTKVKDQIVFGAFVQTEKESELVTLGGLCESEAIETLEKWPAMEREMEVQNQPSPNGLR